MSTVMESRNTVVTGPESEGVTLPQDRFEYSAIVDRPRMRLPRGKRLIVWPVVNIEEWEITQPMPRTVSNPPGGVSVVPDMQNWTWHEYGMRVGIWRIMEVLQKHRVMPTLSINARVCETRPRIAKAAMDLQWEFMAHCYVQMPIHKIEDQRAMIRHTVEVLTKFTGKNPTGWLGPGRGQTYATLDYVAEAGFKWFGDWVLDDQPVWAKTSHGPILAIPYTVELNDITIMLTGRQESDAMLKRVRDAYEVMCREASRGARILAFGVHPYITGAAHRIKYFDAMLGFLRKQKDTVFWNGDQIFDWYSGAVKP